MVIAGGAGNPIRAQVASEDLAYWYLRLNGFLTIPNFVVHPDTGTQQRTDVDVLGVRLPYRAELLLRPMVDDKPFVDVRDRAYLVLAEVKRGQCSLNGPWTDAGPENMQRVLRAIGAFRNEEVGAAAASLDNTGTFSNEAYYVTLLCFGERASSELRRHYPALPQKLWPQVLDFIFQRFVSYRDQKASHPQWDQTGTRLYQLAEEGRIVDEFLKSVTVQ